eukprot:g1015.t1
MAHTPSPRSGSNSRGGSPVDIQVRSGSPTSDSAAIPEGSRVPLSHVPPQRKIFEP